MRPSLLLSFHQKSDLIEGAGFPHSSQELALKPRNTNDPNKYYELLGLSPWATPEEIKAVYKQQVKIYHPDGSSPDAEVFDYLTQIYDVLIDPVKRQQYDSLAPGDSYLGDIELRALREQYSPEQLQDILEEVIDNADYFSYYGTSNEKELAQEWYEVLLAAAHALRIRTTIKVSIKEIQLPHIESGIVVIPKDFDPNYLIAFRLVKRLKGNPKQPSGRK